jgi:folate-binding protein YgfZ
VDIGAAYERVRSEGIAILRPDRGLVRITGPQRVWFLQNTITNDVEGAEQGRWVESCFLDVKGKVVAHFRVGVLDDELLLDVEAPGTRPLTDWFTRNRFRTKVEIENVSPGCVTVVGPRARELAADGEVRRDGDTVIFGGSVGEVCTADVHGGDVAGAVDEALWDVLCVEAGVGRFGVDYGPDTLPQEAGLTHLISVTKGCYIGQEVMARLHFRGHVNKVLRTLRFDGWDGDLAGRSLLEDGKRAGRVTSAVRSPVQGPIGLGMVRVTVPSGGVVQVEDGPDASVGPIPEGTKVSSS